MDLYSEVMPSGSAGRHLWMGVCWLWGAILLTSTLGGGVYGELIPLNRGGALCYLLIHLVIQL